MVAAWLVPIIIILMAAVAVVAYQQGRARRSEEFGKAVARQAEDHEKRYQELEIRFSEARQAHAEDLEHERKTVEEKQRMVEELQQKVLGLAQELDRSAESVKQSQTMLDQLREDNDQLRAQVGQIERRIKAGIAVLLDRDGVYDVDVEDPPDLQDVFGPGDLVLDDEGEPHPVLPDGSVDVSG